MKNTNLPSTVIANSLSILDLSSFEPNWDMFLEEGKYLSFRNLRGDENDNDYIQGDLSFIYFFLYKNKTRKTEVLSERSLDQYLKVIYHFLDYLYNLAPPCPLFNVGYWELDNYQKLLTEGNVNAPATVRRKITIIRALLRFGFQHHYFERDISSYLRPPKVYMVKQTRQLIKKEMNQIVQVLRHNPMNRLIGAFLLLMGLRISELCHARWGHLYEVNSGHIYMKVIGKGNKERHLKLDPVVFQLLLRYRAERNECIVLGKNPEEWLITNSNRKPLNDRVVRKMIERAAIRAGLNKKVSPHWFRHSAATYSLIGGANIVTVMEWLGHSDIRTTQIYLHNIEKENAKGASEYMTDIHV